MTKLLTRVLRKVAELPDERQDDAARVLLGMLENDRADYQLSDAQVAELVRRKRTKSSKTLTPLELDARLRRLGL